MSEMKAAAEAGIATSIKMLMPIMKWRFRVLVNHDWSKLFTRQVGSCNIDYINDHLEFVIRQPSNDSVLHELIYNMCKTSSTNIQVEEMSSTGISLSTLDFSNCKAVKHSYNLSYGEDGIVVHNLTLKFGTMVTSVYEPEAEEPTPASTPKKKRVSKKKSK